VLHSRLVLMLAYLCLRTRPLVVLSWSLQWAQGKLVCPVVEVLLPVEVPLVALVQVQVALVPGSQSHLKDWQD
jgi:hypothetical protein